MATRHLPKLSLVALIVALLGYWLVWSGLPHAVDELSALSVAESLRAGDGFSANQMEWDQARTPPQNAWGSDGNLYSKKGLGVSLAALPFWWAGSMWQVGGAVRFALLVGSLLAALAVAVCVWAAQRIGYDQRVSLLGGVTLGFGTLLFPYARTLFSEAIAAPALMLALGALLVWRAGRAQQRVLLVLAGCGAAGVVLAKSSNGVILPFFFLYVAWVAWRATAARRGKLMAALAAMVWLALPVLLAIGVTIAYNYVRFGTLAGFPLEPFESFSMPLLTGMAGLLVSPGKGLFWYMPVTLIAVAGALMALIRPRRTGIVRADALLLLAVIAAPILLYALWYDWPGGRAWGPRMIAWVAPAIVLLALPVLAELFGRTQAKGDDSVEPLSPGRRAGRWVVGILLALSLAAQLLGALLNFEAAEAAQMTRGVSFDALLWQAGSAPLLTYWREFSAATLEPLLLQQATWRSAPFGTSLAVVLGAIAGWLVYRYWRRGETARLWVALVAALLAGVVLVAATVGDPRWQDRSANPEDNDALVAWLNEHSLPADLLIFDLDPAHAFQSRAWWRQNTLPARPSFLGWLRKEDPWAGLNSPDESLLYRTASDYARSLLVLQEMPEEDPASTTELYLDQYFHKGAVTWLGAQRVVEYYRYTGERQPLAGGGELLFDSGADGLIQWSVVSGDVEGSWLISLAWNRATSPDLRFSVQALDAAGNVVGQIDRAPIASNGRVGFYAPGATRIILKLYDPVTGDVTPIRGQEAYTLWQEEM